MNKLEIEKLSKIYGKKVANDKITVTLENGVYGLLGPNGAGKSTLMKQITTLIKPDEGQILYNGEDIFKMDADYRNILGYLPQEFGVYKNFTAKEFLQYIGALKGLRGKYLNSKIGELLDLVGLYDVRNKSIGKFSGGMKRRVGIAQVLLNDPKIMSVIHILPKKLLSVVSNVNYYDLMFGFNKIIGNYLGDIMIFKVNIDIVNIAIGFLMAILIGAMSLCFLVIKSDYISR
ncbi:ABC transporter multidrug-family ATP-binding protein [Clostridioides difficile]|uniref:ATP-binding cassette domain-containing protein n=1 Tax=Clostridioides difficile TaxID=1496 RepID=UPI0010254EA1|nr:ABC transporter multidrug-family ATP-binding protein [Clostridioides difficile]